MEAKFLSLSCPSCGGKLQITSDIERFACTYCGKEHVVNRGGGVVTLKPVLDKLQQVSASIERSAQLSGRAADELTLQRLQRERETIEAQAPAHFEAIRKRRAGASNNSMIALVAIAFGLIWLAGYAIYALQQIGGLLYGRGFDLGGIIGGGLGALVVGGAAIGFGILVAMSARKIRSEAISEEAWLRNQMAQMRTKEAEVRARLQ